MCYKNMGTTFLHFVTNYAFDRQTNGRTDKQDRETAFSWLDRVACNACSAVKIPACVSQAAWPIAYCVL